MVTDKLIAMLVAREAINMEIEQMVDGWAEELEAQVDELTRLDDEPTQVRSINQWLT